MNNRIKYSQEWSAPIVLLGEYVCWTYVMIKCKNVGIKSLAGNNRGKNVDKDGNPVYLPDLVKRVMESVIRFRVQMNRPIWFASNTDPKFVKDVFSEDIASLLREAVVPLCVRGDDFRREIQRRNKRKFIDR